MHLSGDTLHTHSGFLIVQGQKLKIGNGSMPNGDFRFIRINTSSLFRQTSNKGHQGLSSQLNVFSRQNAGLEFEVIRIDRRGNKKQSFDYYPIISAGLVRYEIDIDHAIASGEIVVPDAYRSKPAAVTVKEAVKQ